MTFRSWRLTELGPTTPLEMPLGGSKGGRGPSNGPKGGLVSVQPGETPLEPLRSTGPSLFYYFREKRKKLFGLFVRVWESEH